MEKHNILTFMLPTNNPTQFFKTLFPTFKNIGKLKEISTFVFLIQEDVYSKEQVEEISKELDSLDIRYIFKYKDYYFNPGDTPILEMRHDCSMMVPDSLFYAFLDDDMTFEAGTNEFGYSIDLQYLNAINIMLNSKTNVALLKKQRPKETHYLDEFITYMNLFKDNFWVENGLILKGGIFANHKGLSPRHLLRYYGSNEDMLMCLERLKGGANAIVLGNAMTNHYENRDVPGYIEYGWKKQQEKRESILKYIGRTYGDVIKIQPTNFLTYEKFIKDGTKNIRNEEDEYNNKIEYNKDIDNVLDAVIKRAEEVYNALTPFDYHNILGFAIPTCEPDTMENILLPSLVNILPLKDICTINLNFQKPYKKEQIDSIVSRIRRMGFTVIHTFNEYPDWKENKLSVAKLREDAARLSNSLVYSLLDDDMQFVGGYNKYLMDINTQYLNIIKKILSDRRVSVGQLTDPNPKEYLNGSMLYRNIRFDRLFTGRGMLVRGGCYYGFNGVLPDEITKLSGGDSDITSASYRIQFGENVVEIPFGMCNHIQNSPRGAEGAWQYGWDKNNETKNSVRYYRITHWTPHYVHGKNMENFSEEIANKIYEKGALNIANDDIKSTTKMSIDLDFDDLLIEVKSLAFENYKALKEKKNG